MWLVVYRSVRSHISSNDAGKKTLSWLPHIAAFSLIQLFPIPLNVDLNWGRFSLPTGGSIICSPIFGNAGGPYTYLEAYGPIVE